MIKSPADRDASATDPTNGSPRKAARDSARGDTFAWLVAAAQVIGPILLVITAVAAALYGLLALLF